MPFISTRGGGGSVPAAEAILRGLAPDGGLYMPLCLPQRHAAPDYAGTAAELLADAFRESFPEDDLRAMAEKAYAADRFGDASVCPMAEVGGHLVLELFHGPTASFKDLALSLRPDGGGPGQADARQGDPGAHRHQRGHRLRHHGGLPGYEGHQGDRVLSQEWRKPRAGRADAANGRRQSPAVAISGDFDQAQQGVKAIFREADSIAPGLMLSSANSINIGRLIPQMAYYMDASRRLGDEGAAPVYSVPTGNFGDIFAGLLCKEAGLPMERLLCATNDNRVLADTLQSGIYDRRRKLIRTLSPSMDILVSSNFERALYLASGGDSALVGQLMARLEGEGQMWLPDPLLQALRRSIQGMSHGDAQGLQAIREVWLEHGYLMDPHTAAAWLALQVYLKESGSKARGVVLATASPYKFPKAALIALGQPVPENAREQLAALRDLCGVPMPAGLEGLFDRPVIHDEVISPEGMADYVKEKAQRW